MKRLSLALLSFLPTLTLPALGQGLAEPYDLYVQEFRALAQKIQAGEPITVAYLGGSITTGAITAPTTDPNGGYDFSDYHPSTDSWRALSFQMLTSRFQQYPGQFTMLNASIPATPSELGAYRFQDHVASAAPDLLLLEFCVNDVPVGPLGPVQDRSVPRTMTSLVRQAEAANPDVAIASILTTIRRVTDLDDEFTREFLFSREKHRRTACHLGLPFADMTRTIWEQTPPPGIDPARTFAGPDTNANRVHPSPHGHLAYAVIVDRLLSKLLTNPTFRFPDSGFDVPVVPYPRLPSLHQAFDVPDGYGWFDDVNDENWIVTPVFQDTLVNRVSIPSAVFEFRFYGSAVATWWQSTYSNGPFQGLVEMTLDGNPVGSFAAGYAPGLGANPLRRYTPVAEGLDPDVLHALRIKVPLDQPDAFNGVINLALHGIVVDEY